MRQGRKKQPKTTVILSPEATQQRSLLSFISSRPDTEVKILNKSKLIKLEDIKEINDQIQSKLNTYSLKGHSVSVNLVTSDNSVKSYDNCTVILNENWTTQSYVKTVGITWDAFIDLPEYDIPQRYTLKLRLGSSATPEELLHLTLFTHEDHEWDEAVANCVVRVDYVNRSIATELIAIVTLWHESLEGAREVGWIENKVTKSIALLAQLIEYVVPLSLLWLLYGILSLIPNRIEQIRFDIPTSLIAVTLFFIFWFFGQILARKMYKKGKKLKDYPMFAITRGDIKRIDEAKQNNAAIIKDIAVEVVVYILIGASSSIVRLFFK